MLKYDKAVFIIFILASFALAQIPQTINYQGYLTDSNGNPLSGNYNIKFSIYNSATGGTAIWSETHNSVTVTNGVFGVILGEINPVPLELFDGTDKFLGITVGTDPEMTPRQKFTSVGYAFRADNANDIKGKDIHPNKISIENKIEIGDRKIGNDPDAGAIYLSYQGVDQTILQSRDWGGGLWVKYNNNTMATLQSSYDGGGLWIYGQNNNLNVVVSSRLDNNDWGSIGVFNENGNENASLQITSHGSGGLFTDQSDGDPAITISTWRTNTSSPQTEAGWIAVYDENGNEVIKVS